MAEPKETTERKNGESEQDGGGAATQPHSNKAVIIAVVVSSAVALILCTAIGILALTALRQPTRGMMSHTGPTEATRGDGQQRLAPDAMGEAPERERFFGMRGEGNSSTRVSGVITSVDGDNFVVAGNGKTVTVTKNSDTTIRGTSTSIAVNDSVTISGTENGSAFMATTIIVRNISSN